MVVKIYNTEYDLFLVIYPLCCTYKLVGVINYLHYTYPNVTKMITLYFIIEYIFLFCYRNVTHF